MRGIIRRLCCIAMTMAASLAVQGTAAAACPPRSAPAEFVFAGGLCLAIFTFGAETAGSSPDLAVVVHGDISDGGAATYHVAFARELARPGLVVVALVRPGYVGPGGRASQGDNLGRQDNYTPEVVAALAGAITALKRRHRARRTIYVGHSGGAALGGVLIGRRPGLVAGAVLASCPCNLAQWVAAKKLPAWTRSISPSDVAHRVPDATSVIAITGAADANTTSALARDYVLSLQRRGVAARFDEVAAAGHGLSGLRDAVVAAVETLRAR